MSYSAYFCVLVRETTFSIKADKYPHPPISDFSNFGDAVISTCLRIFAYLAAAAVAIVQSSTCTTTTICSPGS